MTYATRTLTATAALALFAFGMAPEFVDALSFGDALRAMRYVGGSSNAAAILKASNEYRELIAPAVAALVVVTFKK